MVNVQLGALLDACAEDPSAACARDAAIIALGYACGLRRAELVALDLDSYDRTTRTLTIHGKRRKIHAVPLEAGVDEALEDWLAVRGDAAGPLFVRIQRGGHFGSERLTDQAVYHIQATRVATAGVARFSPRDLRRTFAGDLLDAGVDLATVQSLMGYSNANTTARHNRRGERAKWNGVKLLHVPHRKGER